MPGAHNKTDGTVRRRVVVVDDHPMIRERIAMLLNQEADLCTCGEADSVESAMSVVTETLPDIVIVDLALKRPPTLELIKELRARFPALFIVVYSMHDEELYAERALRAGAHGYVTKLEGSERVLQALREVTQGRIYVSERIRSRIMKKAVHGGNAPARGSVEGLSDRELEVFSLLGEGFGPSEVASRLHVSVKTVEAYCARIKEKLNLRDASELTQRAIQWERSRML